MAETLNVDLGDKLVFTGQYNGPNSMIFGFTRQCKQIIVRLTQDY